MNGLLTFLTFLFLVFRQTSSCFGLGCLGVGCLTPLPPPCLFGPCLRTPMIMPCPCQIGFQCTPAGCMVARARGAKTYKDHKLSDDEQTVEDPNSHFLTCCNLLDVPESCNSMCSYEGYTKEAIQSAVIIPTQCPTTALPQIHFCAARGADHTECCRDAKIDRNCHVFCDQRPGNTTQLSFTHLKCFEQFDDIRGCFLERSLREYYEAKMRKINEDM